MKKLLFVLVLLLASQVGVQAKARKVVDKNEECGTEPFYPGLVGRGKLALEYTTKAKFQPEFLINFLEIGRINSGYIAAIDSGPLLVIDKHTGHVDGVQWATGFKIHLASIFRSCEVIPESWWFISNLELDARGSYNWSQHHSTYGLVLAYPFL